MAERRAMKPWPLTTIAPPCPRRARHASRSMYAIASATAASCAATISRVTAGSAIPNRMPTLLGARNVRSKPATAPSVNARPSSSPVAGSRPSSSRTMPSLAHLARQAERGCAAAHPRRREPRPRPSSSPRGPGRRDRRSSGRRPALQRACRRSASCPSKPPSRARAGKAIRTRGERSNPARRMKGMRCRRTLGPRRLDWTRGGRRFRHSGRRCKSVPLLPLPLRVQLPERWVLLIFVCT